VRKSLRRAPPRKTVDLGFDPIRAGITHPQVSQFDSSLNRYLQSMIELLASFSRPWTYLWLYH
jgi:hypothetical protein